MCFAVLSIFGRASPAPSLDWLCVARARRVEAWGSRRLYVRCLLCVLCGVPRILGVGCYLCAGCKNFVCSRVDLSVRTSKCCPFVVCRAISVGAVQRVPALGGVKTYPKIGQSEKPRQIVVTENDDFFLLCRKVVVSKT